MKPAADSDPPKPGDSYVQSFARGLAVIRSFNAESPSQTLTEVAQRTGLTRAGARRILLTLQTLGYVSAEGRQFRLTARILDLGFAYLSSQPMWNLAEPVMQALVAELKESCSASVLDGDDIVYVLRVPTQKILDIGLAPGSRLPAYCTSMGRVLLAGLPAEECRRRVLAMDRVPRTARTVVDTAALLQRIDAVRSQGWALVDQELEEGLVSLAAPVTDRAGRTIAALNISGQAGRTPPALMQERFLAPLRAAARQISQLVRMKT